MQPLTPYDTACTALGTADAALDDVLAALNVAATTDAVMDARARAKGIEALARVANNLDIEIKGARARIQAEAKLGEMLRAESAQGLLRRGRDRAENSNGSAEEPLTRVKLREIGVSKKLSSHAQRLANAGAPAITRMLDTMEAESRKRGRIAHDIITQATAKRSAATRRALAREMGDCAALKSTGRKFAVGYADPAWIRKAGIGDRAYENHYDTMTWDEIIAMGPAVKSRMLDDAWFFIWVPRAHMLALHPTEVDTPLGRTIVKMPLIWAVAQAFGCDDYSTCHVWHKGDTWDQDNHGTGLIFWDQDEILCLFKRGRGLPMPETKFNSSHCEAPEGHSAKPPFYRDMINAMTGGLPVLELFAREDEEHVLPENFYTWGNQSKNTANAA